MFVVNPQTLGALVAESGATRGRLQTLVITDVLKSAAGRARMTRHDLHDLCHGLHVSPQPNDAELVISIARDRQKCRRSTGCMYSRPLQQHDRHYSARMQECEASSWLMCLHLEYYYY